MIAITTRAVFVCAAAMMSVLHAQTPAKITYVSVTPSEGEGEMRMRTGDMEVHGRTLRRIISAAYMTAERRIVGGPSWLDSEGFDVIVKTEPANLMDFRATVREVLAQHFGLEAHKETREMPVYVLKTAEGLRLKLKQAAGERSRVDSDDGRIQASETPMWLLANHLERYADRLVVDETGLKDGWDFKLDWGGGGTKAMRAAVTKELGLELVESTRPVEVVVIDKVEKLKSK